MLKKYYRIYRICALLLTGVLFVFGTGFNGRVPIRGAGYEDLAPGTYQVEGTLSCLVTAMGGIEFGSPLLKNASITVSQDKSCTMTLFLGKSAVTIYGVTCDTFVDSNPAGIAENRGVENGTIGYYDKNGVLVTDGVTYIISERDTALNTRSEPVAYVEEITFPIAHVAEVYNLTLFVNSNVMGVQFCNKSENTDGAVYPAVLTVKWDTLSAQGNGQGSTPAATILPSPSPQPQNTPAVVQEDGLSIHYANGSNGNGSGGSGNGGNPLDPTAKQPSYTAYVRTDVLVFAGIASIVLIGLGAFFLISTRLSKSVKGEERN